MVQSVLSPAQTFRHGRATLGVLAGWQFYRTSTTLSYLAPVYRGIVRAAQEQDVNLLLGCGMGASATDADPLRPAWPLLSPEVDFVPIGMWNTDGLIVINPLHSETRIEYIQALISAGHPVLFIGAGSSGNSIVADNAAGTFQAVQHLIGHGHRQIAFIAGSPEDLEGDTGIRLSAYYRALQQHGLDLDPHRVAYGRHVISGGYAAMKSLIASGVSFSAVVASNDESAMGAMQALREVGCRIPQDVAVIGFDDRLECAVQEPPLTSVRIPLFNLGYHAVEMMCRHLMGNLPLEGTISIPGRLIVRESCGCKVKQTTPDRFETSQTEMPTSTVWQSRLEARLSAHVLDQAQSLPEEAFQVLVSRLIEAFEGCLRCKDQQAFQRTLEGILAYTAAFGDEVHIWQDAISILAEEVPAFWASEGFDRSFLERMVEQSRLFISAQMQRQHRQYVVHQRWINNCLSLLTAKLLMVLDESKIFEILAQHLPQMDIHSGLVVRFEAEEDDPTAWCSIHDALLPETPPLKMRTRSFPPEFLFLTDQQTNKRFSLTLVPLVTQAGQLGFVVFDCEHLDLYGAIVQQLASALNTNHLYREATEARRLAEEANLMKSRFLSTVSHELRTPLNLIVGLSGILLQAQEHDKTPTLPPNNRRDIERIHAQAQHLAGLIGDVLDLASSDSGQLRLSNDYLDLAQVLKIVVETGRHLAAEKGLTWHADLPDSGPWVWGDRTRLRQVTLNLISNAIKFTAQGSVSLQVEVNDDVVTISVRDTGLGISPEDQAVIFDEFRQSERTVARGYGGLGLGLAICKRLVELHGGAIGVQSEGGEGDGSVFYFTLPVVHRAAPEDVPSSTSPVADQSVLLLTSLAGISEQLRSHLRQRGFEVRLALIDVLDGWQSKLAVNPPDAVIFDVSAASDQVWNALKTVMGNPAMQGVPILFYASSQESGAIVELNYLTKPIRIPELKHALSRQWSGDESNANHTFLIVDDEPNTLEMHARIVESFAPSGRVLKAHTGQEALDILRSTAVDLVLLDLMMPDMDGFGVLEAMREHEHSRHIPVIVVTGRLLTESDMSRLNRGVATILSKGLFSLEETVTHISNALNRQRKLSSEAQRLVRQAMAYLHEHYPESITRRDIAQHVGLAEDYLTHCFRQELGMTPIAYLNRYRVNQAKLLLKETPRSITEIAMDVGFSDSGYFSRVFRREIGVTPDAFRRA
ncbi:MAG: substrate-binding domain-containing protein [Anaerolinea sp.]|nr:substrate-binding domain-containing protein [Anaerolinea sp.]